VDKIERSFIQTVVVISTAVSYTRKIVMKLTTEQQQCIFESTKDQIQKIQLKGAMTICIVTLRIIALSIILA
jgi:hypothetical protein